MKTEFPLQLRKFAIDRRGTLVWAGSLFLLATLLSCPAQANTGKVYKHLVVRPFEVPTGMEFPADFAAALQHNLLEQLHDSKRFELVTLLDAGQTPPPDADLVLTGKLTKFNKGSRAERYVVGFGAGSTKIKASVSFVDPSSNKSILDRDVGGRVSFGLFGGDSKRATRGLAHGLAKAAKALP